ncbi:MAG: hypothetical protein K5882_10555 [Bacteroidales bacterium]|nr:hypothetical protein [Bacteroidales bacterium]
MSERPAGHPDTLIFSISTGGGWGGQLNGYFALTSCSSYGFNSNHAIIIGIRSPELPATIGEHRVKNVQAFPNPTNGSVFVCTESQPVLETLVFDMFGRKLSQKTWVKKSFVLTYLAMMRGFTYFSLSPAEVLKPSKSSKK